MKSTHHKHVVWIASIACLGGLLFGFDTGIIADVHQQIVSQYQLSTMQWSLIVSITVIGAFLGALFSARLADLLGRKKALIILSYTFIIATLILCFANGFWMLLFGRALIGVCIGIASYITPLFIAELSPKNNRGQLVLFNSIAITMGECFAFLSGYGVYDERYQSWRVMFLIGIIPAILLIIGMKKIPRSPRWLVMKGRLLEARQVLEKIRAPIDVEKEWHEIKENIKHPRHEKKLWSLIHNKLRPVFFLGLSLGILQQFSGINTIMYFGPHIFLSAGIGSTQFAIAATFILGLINVVGTVTLVFLVDVLGRRKLMMLGTLVACFSLCAVGITYESKQVLVTLIAMCCFIFFYAISIGSLFWLIIAEIYPAKYRSLAMSTVAAIQWLANFVIAIGFLPLHQYLGNAGHIFYFFGFMCFIAFLVSLYFLPETKGVSLEVIEKNIHSGMRVRNLGEHGWKN